MIKTKFIFIFFFAGITAQHSLHAQSVGNKINDLYTQQQIERYMREKEWVMNYSLKPYYIDPEKLDSIFSTDINREGISHEAILKWGSPLKNNLLFNQTQDVKIAFNPLFDFSYGYEKVGENNRVTDWDLGYQLDINYRDKLFISSSLYENNARLPNYLRQYVDSLTVVPGMGKARTSGKTVNYTTPFGHIGYKPNNSFYFEFGQDKNFLGSGYRSLLLSDYSYPYPYLKIIYNLGHFSYTNIWSQFVDASNNWKPYGNDNKNGYPKKYGSFNYLTYIGNKFQVSAFQSMIWANYDSLGNKRSQQWGYFVPIIYLNALNFNQGSPDNSMMGLDLNYQFSPNMVGYGQLVIDDFNMGNFFKGKTGTFLQEKYGTQIGLKWWNPFHWNNAYLQVEYNAVRPYTYNHRTPMINYSHFNEPLAHPLGANFREFILLGNYRYNNWLFEAELMYAQQGRDSSTNVSYGADIHKTEHLAPYGDNSYNNVIGQGINTHVWYGNLGIHYLLNPFTNSRLSLQITQRGQRSFQKSLKDNIISIGFSTNLRNKYKDI